MMLNGEIAMIWFDVVQQLCQGRILPHHNVTKLKECGHIANEQEFYWISLHVTQSLEIIDICCCVPLILDDNAKFETADC